MSPAAILAGDVSGYSRLMGADEEGTMQLPDGYAVRSGRSMPGTLPPPRRRKIKGFLRAN
jgi:hypothetical protein